MWWWWWGSAAHREEQAGRAFDRRISNRRDMARPRKSAQATRQRGRRPRGQEGTRSHSSSHAVSGESRRRAKATSRLVPGSRKTKTSLPPGRYLMLPTMLCIFTMRLSHSELRGGRLLLFIAAVQSHASAISFCARKKKERKKVKRDFLRYQKLIKGWSRHLNKIMLF